MQTKCRDRLIEGAATRVDPAVQLREGSACERGLIRFCEPMKQGMQLPFTCLLSF
jgi:hypothetical protein